MAEPVELTIQRLGAQGDGVAEADTPGRPVFVPFTLAGERVLAKVEGERGKLLELLTSSPERVTPECRHFGTCGGCSVQHLAPATYEEWKRELVVAAFRSRGIDANVAPLQRPHGKRRRAVMSAIRRESGAIALGFHAAASHDLIDLDECTVLAPQIVSLLPALRELLALVIPRRAEARATVTLTNAGLDVALEGVERELTPAIRTELARRSVELGLARLAIGRDVVVQTLPPQLKFGAADVEISPGVFVQAVAEAEQGIAKEIMAAVGKAKSVADLFSGAGAFTFPLAARAKVSAFDGDKSAIAALQSAVRNVQGLKPVTARVRDLFREPLSALELNEHEAIVFDPPRAGAEMQSQRIAKSKVKTVVAVSCNPATLARDARILLDGGYKLGSVTPVDQFTYSAHVEVVAVFRR